MGLYSVTNGASGVINAFTPGAAIIALDQLDAIGARPPAKNHSDFCRRCDETIAVIDGLYASGARVDASAAKRSFGADGKPVRRVPGFTPFETAKAFKAFNGSNPQPALPVRDGVTQLPRRV